MITALSKCGMETSESFAFQFNESSISRPTRSLMERIFSDADSKSPFPAKGSMKFTDLIQLHDFNTITPNLHPRCTPAKYYMFFSEKLRQNEFFSTNNVYRDKL